MSSLASSWLEKHFKIPGKISSLERDLANGYILLLVAEQCELLTPEQMEASKNSQVPSDIVENFKLLNKGLEKWHIKLNKSEIANIVSELPGSVADLVLKIKRKVEHRDHSNLNTAYKESIKTLRPKTFTRETEYFQSLSSKEKFLNDTKYILDHGTYNDVDLRCQLSKYETFKYDEDDKIRRDIELEEKQRLDARTTLRETMLQKDRSVHDANTLAAKTLKENWKVTQQVKKDRQIRDLQFENATYKIAELKKMRSSKLHRNDEETGIDAFEKNLLRSGIGANDDDGKPLSTTYEDGEIFLQRMETTAMKKWPTSEDVNNFITQLKLRTKEKRQARYEKLRRKRRMLVEQSSMAKANALFEESEQLADDAQGDHEEDALAIKQQQKEAKIKDNYEKYKQNLQETLYKAHSTLMEFAEQCRMRVEETDERNKAMKQILENRESKIKSQKQLSQTICCELVHSLVSDMLDSVDCDLSGLPLHWMQLQPLTLASSLAVNGSSAASSNVPLSNSVQTLHRSHSQSAMSTSTSARTHSTPNPNPNNPNIGSTSRPNSHHTNKSRGGQNRGAAVLLERDLFNSEVWLQCSTLSGNLSSWKTKTRSEDDCEPAAVDRNSQLTFRLRDMMEGLLVALSDPKSAIDSLSESIALSHAEQRRVVEGCQQKTDSSLEAVSGSGSGLGQTMAPLNVLGILHDASQCTADLGSVVDRCLKWCNASSSGTSGDQVPLGPLADVFDLSCAISGLNKIRPLLEAKVPSLSFQAAFEAFFATGVNEDLKCPESLGSQPVSVQALRVAVEALEVASRIAAVLPTSVTSLNTVPFTDTSMAILLGQALWMRQYVTDKLRGASASEVLSRSPRVLLVSLNALRHSDLGRSWDRAVDWRVLDWFLRGGSRDNVPETDVELVSAIANEMGPSAKNSKAKPKPKGKPNPDEILLKSPVVNTFIWLSSGTVSDVTTPNGGDIPVDRNLSDVDKVLVAYHRVKVAETCPSDRVAKTKALEAELMTHMSSIGPSQGRLLVIDFDENNKSQPVVGSEEICTTNGTNGEDVPSESLPLENPKSQTGVLRAQSSYEVSEVLVATIADWFGSSSVSPAPATRPGTSGGQSPPSDGSPLSPSWLGDVEVRHVQEVVESRRGRLSRGDQLVWNHMIGARRLDVVRLLGVYISTCECEKASTESIGRFLAVLQAYLRHVDLVMANHLNQLLMMLKSSDPRWKQLCVETEGKLKPLVAAQSTMNMASLTSSMQRTNITNVHRQGSTNNNNNNTNNNITSNVRLQQELHESRVAQVRVLVQDLICSLGDVIDDRHCRWLSFCDQIKSDCKDLLANTATFVWNMLLGLEDELNKQAMDKRAAVLAMCQYLEDSGYKDFSLSTSETSANISNSGSDDVHSSNNNSNNSNSSNNNPSESSNSTDSSRRTLDLKKNHLRSLIILLEKAVHTSSPSSLPLGDHDGEGLWRSLVAMETPSLSQLGDSSIKFASLMECQGDLWDSLSTLLLSCQYCLHSTEESVRSLLSSMAESVRVRHSYEHRMLSMWSSECVDSYAALNPTTTTSNTTTSNTTSINPNAQTFLSRYYFGVSSSSQQDGVQSPVDLRACVHVGDLKLPLNSLAMLAQRLVQRMDGFVAELGLGLGLERSEGNITNEKALQAFHDFVISTVQSLNDSPMLWAYQRDALVPLLDGVYRHLFESEEGEVRVVSDVLVEDPLSNPPEDPLAVPDEAQGPTESVTPPPLPVHHAPLTVTHDTLIKACRLLVLSLCYSHVSEVAPLTYIARVLKVFSKERFDSKLRKNLLVLCDPTVEVFTKTLMADKVTSQPWWVTSGRNDSGCDESSLMEAIWSIMATICTKSPNNPNNPNNPNPNPQVDLATLAMLLARVAVPPGPLQRSREATLPRLLVRRPDSTDLLWADRAGDLGGDVSRVPHLSALGLCRGLLLASRIALDDPGSPNPNSPNPNPCDSNNPNPSSDDPGSPNPSSPNNPNPNPNPNPSSPNNPNPNPNPNPIEAVPVCAALEEIRGCQILREQCQWFLLNGLGLDGDHCQHLLDQLFRGVSSGTNSNPLKIRMISDTCNTSNAVLFVKSEMISVSDLIVEINTSMKMKDVKPPLDRLEMSANLVINNNNNNINNIN